MTLSRPTTDQIQTGTMWTAVGFGASTLLRFASNVVLAKLLFPEAFGLMALVGVILQGLFMFSDVGIQTVIVQHQRGDDRSFLNTAWTIQVIRGLLIFVLVLALSAPFASLYGDEMLALLVPAAGVTAIIAGFNSTSIHTERRHIRARRISIVELLAQFAASSVMITAALIQPSVWALLVGTFASSLTTLALSHLWLADSWNRFRFDRSSAYQIFTFGKWIFLSSLLTFLVGHGDRMAFGKLATLETLGVYAIASVLAMLPTTVLAKLSQAIVFPALCRLREADADDFSAGLPALRTPFIVVGMVGTSCLCVAAPTVIDLLYDSRYQEAGWMLQILLLGVVFRIIEMGNAAVLLANGDAKFLAFGGVAKLACMVILITIGYVWFGFTGAVAGFAASEIGRYLVSAVAVRRLQIHTLSSDCLMLLSWWTVTAIGVLSPSFELVADRELIEMLVAVSVTAGLWLLIVLKAKWAKPVLSYLPLYRKSEKAVD